MRAIRGIYSLFHRKLCYKSYIFRMSQILFHRWKQSFSITVHNKQIGILEICHLEKKPELEKRLFLEEE